MEKAWIWYDEQHNGTMGARIDLEKQRVSWFFEAGCGCTDANAEQSVQDFLQNGSNFVMPPHDILEEMQAVLSVREA